MAKRTARSGIPLEWKTDQVQVVDTTAATATNGEFDLDLLPDEIAEIYAISACFSVSTMGEIDNDLALGMYLSMDPDASASPFSTASVEDLETFFTHFLDLGVSAVTAASAFFTKRSQEKLLMLPEKFPILVGTNISQVVLGVSTVDVTAESLVTIYFKRKKASAMDLNQILLKRR